MRTGLQCKRFGPRFLFRFAEKEKEQNESLCVCTFSASHAELQAVFAPFFFSQKEESRNAVKKEKVFHV